MLIRKAIVRYKLIDMILQLNPNVQIILTTHSPMINKGKNNFFLPIY